MPVYPKNPATGGVGGIGDVVGPASSTDNAIVRFDGTTGKLIQDSGVIINDHTSTIATFSEASGASSTSNYLNITRTFPSTLTAIIRGAYFEFTGAGSSAQSIRGLDVGLIAGFTGNAATIAGRYFNSSAGTQTTGFTGGGNQGVQGNAAGTTAGHNVGASGLVSASSALNLGVLGRSASSTNTPALNVGMAGFALSATTNVGGFFGLSSSAPTLSSSAALIADNGGEAADIFVARDNGTAVWTIQDGGNLIANTDNTYDIGASGATRPRDLFLGRHATIGGRLLESQGADVASANDLTLGADGNSFEITGAVQINAITTSGWTIGSRITLIFASTPTVKHNTAGGAGTAVILLAGAADFSATAGDTLTLLLSEIGGTQAWREIGRAVI